MREIREFTTLKSGDGYAIIDDYSSADGDIIELAGSQSQYSLEIKSVKDRKGQDIGSRFTGKFDVEVYYSSGGNRDRIAVIADVAPSLTDPGVNLSSLNNFQYIV
jgi:hypothetical protein